MKVYTNKTSAFIVQDLIPLTLVIAGAVGSTFMAHRNFFSAGESCGIQSVRTCTPSNAIFFIAISLILLAVLVKMLINLVKIKTIAKANLPYRNFTSGPTPPSNF